MTPALPAFVERTLDRDVPALVRMLAAELGAGVGVQAVLFYGSNLRTGQLDGVLDFYVLTDGPPERGMWPRVGYREITIDGVPMRAKIAAMRAATFARAAADETLDTTIWARFAQPAALVWSAGAAARQATVAAVAAAMVTAARYAAALGPAAGPAAAYWRALFAATYRAELRVERSGRHDEIVARDRAYYDALLPLAWRAAALPFGAADGCFHPMLTQAAAGRLRARWRRRRTMGKPINVARLVRAAFTFDGAARYGAWKIERHTGVAIALTPWRERHPVLAAPGVMVQVWRATRS